MIMKENVLILRDTYLSVLGCLQLWDDLPNICFTNIYKQIKHILQMIIVEMLSLDIG